MLDVAGLCVILALVCPCCGVVVLVFVTVLGFVLLFLFLSLRHCIPMTLEYFVVSLFVYSLFNVQVMFHSLA
jgi:hypothetical protein